MICDVCGRDNASTLTFCQDCGRRLNEKRTVSPTPPNGLPAMTAPAPVTSAASVTSGASGASVAPLVPTIPTIPTIPNGASVANVVSALADAPAPAGRKPRPAAPLFSFEGAGSASASTHPTPSAALAVPARIQSSPPPVPRKPDSAPPKPPPGRAAPADDEEETIAIPLDEVAARPRGGVKTETAKTELPRKEPDGIRCAACDAMNPKAFKFCVTCGYPIAEANARPARGKPASAPPPSFHGAPIVGARVVDIVDTSREAAPVAGARSVACPRCNGVCDADTPFCKFCGGPMKPTPEGATSGSKPRAQPEPSTTPSGSTPAPAGSTGATGSAPAAAKPRTITTPPRHPLAMDPAALLAPDDEPEAATSRLDSTSLREATSIGIPVDLASRTSSPSRVRAATEPSREARAPGDVRLLPFSNDEAAMHRAPIELRQKQPRNEPQPALWARRIVPASELEPPPDDADPALKSGGGRLVVIVEDGSEGRSFSLAEGHLDIGRTEGDILLEDDPYVSPRHARLRRMPSSWYVQDLDSTNRVYLRLRKQHVLRDGDLLLLGLEVLQFQTVSDGERGLGHAIQHGTFVFGSPAMSRRARLCQRTVEGVTRDVYHLFRDETVIGRESGDIVFTADPFLSRRHATVRRNPVTSEFALVDLDSSNGSYVAIRGEVAISDGDFLRIGQHLFLVDLS